MLQLFCLDFDYSPRRHRWTTVGVKNGFVTLMRRKADVKGKGVQQQVGPV
jgi:hypothetical protein